MKIYLAGHVPKGDHETKNFVDWRKQYEKLLPDELEAKCIYPYDRSPEFDEADFKKVFGYDCSLIKNSDLMIVNAQTRLGVGTSQEMVIAKYFKKPVITVLPTDSYSRRPNVTIRGQLIADWIHPMIDAFSDLIFDDPEQLSALTKERLSRITPKDISVIDKSIDYANKK